MASVGKSGDVTGVEAEATVDVRCRREGSSSTTTETTVVATNKRMAFGDMRGFWFLPSVYSSQSMCRS